MFAATVDEFAAALRRENHTLKRSLTDPRLFDGIGNAYSDEILHRARLSPFVLSRKLPDADVARLFDRDPRGASGVDRAVPRSRRATGSRRK